MKLIIKKAAYFLFTAILLFGSFFIVPGTNNLYAMADTDGLIEIQRDTFKKGTYSGAKVASHVDKEKCADLEIIASGGNHTDGEGNLVFSNYVLFNVCINYDANSKTISGTEIKAYNDRTDWDDMDKANGGKYGGSAEIKTEKQITYGAISAVRRNYLGEVEQYYTPVFCTSLNASSFEQQMFNIDGDYTIYVLFATQKGNVVQRHVLSWSFKVRTYIYLIDKTTGLQIKNSGISGGDVIIDSANRQGVTVDITGAQQWLLTEVDLNNKAELTKSGTYKFIVRNRGFLCEVFYFTIDKESVDKKVYFDTTDFQFLMMIRDLIPISPYEYQATKDNPNSKEILTVNSKFENYQMIDSNNMNQSIEKKSLILIDVKKDNGNLAKNKKLKKVGQDKISSETYNVYKTTDKN